MNTTLQSFDNDVDTEGVSALVDNKDRFDTEGVSALVDDKDRFDTVTASRLVNKSLHRGCGAGDEEGSTRAKSKNHGIRSLESQQFRNYDGIGVFVRHKLQQAFSNPVVFNDFSVVEHLSSLQEHTEHTNVTNPPQTIFWDGSEPKVGVDRDGIPIMVYLPSLFSICDNDRVCKTMTVFHKNNESAIRPKATGPKARNKSSNFNCNTGSGSPMIGVIELGILVEQGHSNQLPRASAANFGNSVTSVSERALLHEAFEFCRSAERTALSFIDPQWYTALMSIRTGLEHSNPVNSLILKADNSVWPSHTVTWNRHIHPHFDKKDHPRGWSSLSVYGTFTSGGDLHIPTLGLVMRFTPRDYACLRGKFLEHSISKFQGGHRFAHTSYSPFSIFDHYEHYLKHISSYTHTKTPDILNSLQNPHRIHRRKLENTANPPKPRSGPFIPYAQLKMNKNQRIFGERARRAKRKTKN